MPRRGSFAMSYDPFRHRFAIVARSVVDKPILHETLIKASRRNDYTTREELLDIDLCFKRAGVAVPPIIDSALIETAIELQRQPLAVDRLDGLDLVETLKSMNNGAVPKVVVSMCNAVWHSVIIRCANAKLLIDADRGSVDKQITRDITIDFHRRQVIDFMTQIPAMWMWLTKTDYHHLKRCTLGYAKYVYDADFEVE